MTATGLLRLYPRAWRDRYGDEFRALLGDGRLGFQQVIDVLSGVIDAWLSSDVRRAVQPASATQHSGGMTMVKAMVCGHSKVRYTTRDALIGAGVMLACTALFLALAVAARQQGWEAGNQVMLALAFPGSMVISMPFWILKGQPWKAQAVIVGGTLAALLGIGYLSSVI